MASLLWFIVVLLVIAWFLGFAVNIGWWIHALLVLALLGVLYNLFLRPILATQSGPTHTHETHTHETHTTDHVHDDHVHRDHVHRDEL